MRIIWLTGVGLLLAAAGCRSTEMGSRPAGGGAATAVAGTAATTTKPASAIGQSVQAILQACAGRRMAFFAEDGKQVDKPPVGTPGSVSIYTKDEAGQDNYTFDANGIVIRHQRSYGENYGRGVWENMK